MKYVAFYDTDEYAYENRSVAPSAANVVRYMAEIISEFIPVQIISPSRTLQNKGIYKKRVCKVADNISLVQPFSVGVSTSAGKALMVLYTRCWLFFYLLCHTEKRETVIVYHSLSVIGPIRLLKKIKKIRVISEVREIYSDVKSSYSSLKNPLSSQQKREWKYVESADGYIFPTDLLNHLCNKKGKPYVIAPGIYKPEKTEQKILNDKMIHVVYAGTLRREKGGAAAAAAAAYLPSNYHVHILGYGSDENIRSIQELIHKVASSSAATVTYDGLLRGEEFKAFLQQCHLGISPQDPRGAFNDTSFPSKVMTYLANGLAVLSIRIPAVEQSPVGKYVHFYDVQQPKSIAKAIMQIDFSKEIEKKELLQGLHLKLKKDLFRLVMGVIEGED